LYPRKDFAPSFCNGSSETLLVVLSELVAKLEKVSRVDHSLIKRQVMPSSAISASKCRSRSMAPRYLTGASHLTTTAAIRCPPICLPCCDKYSTLKLCKGAVALFHRCAISIGFPKSIPSLSIELKWTSSRIGAQVAQPIRKTKCKCLGFLINYRRTRVPLQNVAMKPSENSSLRYISVL
jgi:hypothetical protein